MFIKVKSEHRSLDMLQMHINFSMSKTYFPYIQFLTDVTEKCITYYGTPRMPFSGINYARFIRIISRD